MTVPQGTISPGERFSLLIPQFPGILKDVQSTRLHVNDDVFNENDYLQTDIERVNVKGFKTFVFRDIPQHSTWWSGRWVQW
jgi:hypothetical protein